MKCSVCQKEVPRSRVHKIVYTNVCIDCEDRFILHEFPSATECLNILEEIDCLKDMVSWNSLIKSALHISTAEQKIKIERVHQMLKWLMSRVLTNEIEKNLSVTSKEMLADLKAVRNIMRPLVKFGQKFRIDKFRDLLISGTLLPPILSLRKMIAVDCSVDEISQTLVSTPPTTVDVPLVTNKHEDGFSSGDGVVVSDNPVQTDSAQF